jgi:hypothetical protein
MQDPDDITEWYVEFDSPGIYEVSVRYSALPEWENATYIMEAGSSRIRGTVRASEGWYEYKTENIGQLKVNKKGMTIIRLYPEESLGHYLMYFNSIRLDRIGDPV